MRFRQPTSEELKVLHDAISAIEIDAADFAFGQFPQIRSDLKGIRAGRKIFRPDPTATYAAHWGGRRELQFNCGLETFEDGSAWFRAGVAFSFEPSRSLPDVSLLFPKARLFNEYLNENAEDFADLRMWHWRGNDRDDAYAPRPIETSLLTTGIFVVLGELQPLTSVDHKAVLQLFDRLLPLYRYVEADRTLPPSENVNVHGVGGARGLGSARWAKASIAEREVDIFLRHRVMQERLQRSLQSEGFRAIELEVSAGSGFVDLVAENGRELWFFEVKPVAAPAIAFAKLSASCWSTRFGPA